MPRFSVDHGLRPVLSRTMIPAGEGPDVYGAARFPELGSLWARFIWHHHDLALYHHAIYRHVQERLDAVEEFRAESRRQLEELAPASDDSDEWDRVLLARRGETASAWYLETESIQRFGDQHLVIGLWATVEQFSGKALQITERALGIATHDRANPHRWHRLVHRFGVLNVDLSGCKGYSIIDECRVLNNKLKHVGYVDSELAAFPSFTGQKDKEFDEVSLELQKYSNGVFEFVGQVLESADKVIPGGSKR